MDSSSDTAIGSLANYDHCATCGTTGDLICCDACPQSFHRRCLNSFYKKSSDEDDQWYCSQCRPHVTGEIANITQTDRMRLRRVKYELIDLLAIKLPLPEDSNALASQQPQLEYILRHLDWFVRPRDVISVSRIFLQCPTLHVLASGKKAPAPGICFSSLVKALREATRQEYFDEAYLSLLDKNFSISVGLSRALFYGPQMCFKCGLIRTSRFYCCCCGYIFSIKDEISERAKERHQTLVKNRNDKRLDVMFRAADASMEQEARSAWATLSNEPAILDGLSSSNHRSDMYRPIPLSEDVLLSNATPEERDSALYRLHGAALAGLDYMYYTSLDEKTYDGYCGDIIFLMRSMFVASRGLIHMVARQYFEELLIRWIATKSHDLTDPESLLDTMEVMHVLSQLRRRDSILYGRMNERVAPITDLKDGDISARFTSVGELKMLNGLDGFCFNRLRLHNLLALKPTEGKPAELASDIENDAQTKGDVNVIDPSSVKEQLKAPYGSILRGLYLNPTSMTVSPRCDSPSLPKVDNVDHSIGAKRSRRNRDCLGEDDLFMVRAPQRSLEDRKQLMDAWAGGEEDIQIGTHTMTINWDRMCADIKDTLFTLDICDIIGFTCPINSLPKTPKNYCSHCGFDNLKNSSREVCDKCKHILKQKVDYAALSDALVWAYIFEDVGIDLICGSKRATLKDVVRLLPLARCYQRIDELGDDTFVWECYFVTHVIYVFSDWGQHKLSRQLFSEEFEFIVENMDLVIRLNDPELVGEFLQCLKIMEIDSWRDEDIWHVVTAGHDFLIKSEQLNGLHGRWIKANKSAKNRYHSSYCASIGLQSYQFQQQDEDCPTPRLVQLLLASKK